MVPTPLGRSAPSSIPTAHGLILAAGRGTRFGGAKLLVSLRGKPLVQYVIDAVAEATAAGVLDGATAVVAADDDVLRDLFRDHAIEVVENDAPASGLAHSLQLGLNALAQRDRAPGPEAALVLLGDQPGVRAATIGTLVREWRRGYALVVRPRYADDPEEPGHPVLLDRSCWTLAEEVEGDVGIGALLRARPALVTVVDVPGANPGIETPDDLAAFEETG